MNLKKGDLCLVHSKFKFVVFLMPAEYIFFLCAHLVELIVEYGFTSLKSLLFDSSMSSNQKGQLERIPLVCFACLLFFLLLPANID